MSARCDLDMERQAIGACLLGAGAVRAVRNAGLKPEHLTTTEHRDLLDAIYTVADRDAPEHGPEEHLVRAELQRRGSDISPNRVSELAAKVDAPGNAGPQAARVVELAELRRAYESSLAAGKAASEEDWSAIRQHIENVPTAPSTPDSGWEAEDVAEVLAAVERGDQLVEPPDILPTNTGKCVFHSASIASIAALGGTGKGWVAALTATAILRAGGGVLYLDYEETLPRRLERLISVGAPPPAIASHFRYARPRGPLGDYSQLENLLPPDCRMVVVDAVEPAIATERLTVLKDYNDRANTFIAGWPRYLQQKGLLVLFIDHLPKNSGNPDEPINAVAKFNQVDTQLMLKTIEPLGRGKRGKLSITWTKDRLGFWGKGTVADMSVVSTGRTVDAYIDQRVKLEADQEPTRRMAEVARLIEENPGIGIRELRDLAGGRATVTDDARAALLDGGFIEERKEGRRVELHSVKKYGETDGTRNGYVSGARDTFEVPNVA